MRCKDLLHVFEPFSIGRDTFFEALNSPSLNKSIAKLRKPVVIQAHMIRKLPDMKAAVT